MLKAEFEYERGTKVLIGIGGRVYPAQVHMHPSVETATERKKRPTYHSRHSHAENISAMEVFRDGTLLEPEVASRLYDGDVSPAELSAVCIPSTGRCK